MCIFNVHSYYVCMFLQNLALSRNLTSSKELTVCNMKKNFINYWIMWYAIQCMRNFRTDSVFQKHF